MRLKYKYRKLISNFLFGYSLSRVGGWYLAFVCALAVLVKWWFIFFLLGYYFIHKLEEHNLKEYP